MSRTARIHTAEYYDRVAFYAILTHDDGTTSLSQDFPTYAEAEQWVEIHLSYQEFEDFRAQMLENE